LGKVGDSTFDLMMEDLASAPDLYRPTHYWEVLLPRVIARLKNDGVVNVKHHAHFVPIYRSSAFDKRENLYRFVMNVLRFVVPGGRVLKDGLINHLHGRYEAALDYQLFRSADIESQSPILTRVSESNYGLEKSRTGYMFEFDGNRYSKGSLKYLKALAFLKRSVDTSDVSSVLEIGGGIGPLGEILQGSQDQHFFYVDVDIPPMSYLASEYLKQVLGDDNVLDYSETRGMDVIDLDDIRKTHKAVVLCTWQLPRVKGSIDLFVNQTSFQEMEPEVVRNYGNMVSPLITKYALIHNRKVGQPMAIGDGRGVRVPVSVDDIIGHFTDFEVVSRDSWLAAKHHELVALRKLG
jgi:putative sugar O-methyltransferase